MPRILSIDYGLKRTGLAVTDPFKIVATGLATIESKEIIPFLKNYLQTEAVELIIVGDPKNLDGTATHATGLVNAFLKQLAQHFPAVPVKRVDERFTSKMAQQSIIQSVAKKKDRRNKALVDEIAATILLQDYMLQQGGL
ncbi:MAG: Holliday junction resolvase RuvX [Williamsia sp.]|nr:Holliday junction resolvase RuvX [Williamsia sp.]